MKEIHRIKCNNCGDYHRIPKEHDPIITFACEVCNEEFSSREEAATCEARGKIDPKYPIGTEMASKRNEPPDHKQVVYHLGEVTGYHYLNKHNAMLEYLVSVKGSPDEHLYTVQPGQADAAVALAKLFNDNNLKHLP